MYRAVKAAGAEEIIVLFCVLNRTTVFMILLY